MKRKRETVDASVSNQNAPNTRNEAVKRDLLGQYYTNVTSLREHCLQHLPSTSRLRRKKITSLNTKEDASRIEKALCHLLDNSFVCSHQSSPIATEHNTRHAQWLSFSQKVDESNVTLSCSIADFINVQSEVSESLQGFLRACFQLNFILPTPDCRLRDMAPLLERAEPQLSPNPPIM